MSHQIAQVIPAGALLALLNVSPALAVDLESMVPQWQTIEANAGDDAAHGVAIDSEQNLLVAGYAARSAEADDGLIRYYLADGTLAWTRALGVEDQGSEPPDMRLFDIDLDEEDAFVVAGRTTGDGTYESLTWLERFRLDTATSPTTSSSIPSTSTITSSTSSSTSLGRSWVSDWSHFYNDGLSSPRQEMASVVADTEQVWAAGWSYRSDAVKGRWLTFGWDAETGILIDPWDPMDHDEDNVDVAPDVAGSLAVHHDGSVVVVGQIGVGGTSERDADTDWHVRKYDAAGVLLWEDTWAGVSNLADAATDVVIDPYGDVFVVGYENNGTDNGDGADRDWLILKYEGEGDSGSPVLDWTTHVTDGGDAAAFTVALDNADDLLVGGYAHDKKGYRTWRLSQVASYDGSELAVVTDPAGSDDTILDVDVRDGKVAYVGTYSDESGTNWKVQVYEEDTDGDGVGDSADACPDDPEKFEEADIDPKLGMCPCGVPNVDSDEDGALDCNDECPEDPDKIEAGVCLCGTPDVDGDGDGAEDCIDQCPDDPNKTTLGECGCGAPDDDSDGDGVLGCDDACSGTPEGTPVDEDGCPFEEEPLDTGMGSATDLADSKGCGCDASPGSAGWVALWLAAALARRRR